MPIQSSNPPELITLEEWKGLNQQVTRSSIDDQEQWWVENLYTFGPGELRSCWGPGPAIYIAPTGVNIVRMFFGYIGFPNNQYTMPPPGRFGWMFLDDGNVDQVDLDNGAIQRVGQIWDPMPPYYYADAVVWRPRFFGNTPGQSGGVLFGSPKGYYAWDGIRLYSPGDTAPDWLTSAAEQSDISTVMPSGLPGIIAMEVYQGRVWVMGETVISFSAANNGADFSTAGGGGSFGYSGNKLTVTYRDLAATSGYLYVFGDSSIDMINNVITFGDGQTIAFTTNFNYMNIDPMVGHGFPRKVGRWGRDFVMAAGGRLQNTAASLQNSGLGMYQIRGNETNLISGKLTKLWLTLDVSQFYPTFATLTMWGRRILLCNGRFTDPFGQTRNLLLAWSGEDTWHVMSQNLNLTHVGYYEQDSICDAYGTDGRGLYHLFQQPDNTLIKKLSTKAYHGKGPLGHITINTWKRAFLEVNDNSGLGVSFTGTATTKGGGVPNGTENIAFQLAPGETSDIIPQPMSGQGIQCGVDLQSTSPDFSIARLHLGTDERALFGP